jgi:ADP-heptose:LPS heptosyltransferase
MITYTKQLNLSLALKTLLKRKANRVPKEGPKKVVALFLTKNIGDMIFATPVFHALKVAYPNAHLTVIGSPKNRIMLEGNSDVDDYAVCPDTAAELISIIKNIGADYGFSLSTSTVDVATLILGGIPAVAAFEVVNAKAGTASYKLVLRQAIRVPFYIGQYYASEYLRILEPLGVKSADVKKRLFYTDDAKQKVQAFLQKEGVTPADKIAIMSPGAGTKIKQWPADRFAAVADHVHEKFGWKIAVIGGPGDKAETETFIASLKKARPLVYVDSSLDELKAFIAHAHLLMANDSGPVYFAEAFSVPTLVVVGPTDENEHPPKGEYNRIVAAPNRGKAELQGHLEGFDKEQARKQIADVTVDLVISEIDSLISIIK